MPCPFKMKKGMTAGTSGTTGSNMMHTTADGMKKASVIFGNRPAGGEERIPGKPPKKEPGIREARPGEKFKKNLDKSFKNTPREKVKRLSFPKSGKPGDSTHGLHKAMIDVMKSLNIVCKGLGGEGIDIEKARWTYDSGKKGIVGQSKKTGWDRHNAQVHDKYRPFSNTSNPWKTSYIGHKDNAGRADNPQDTRTAMLLQSPDLHPSLKPKMKYDKPSSY